MADEEKKAPRRKPKSDEAPKRPSTRKAAAQKKPTAAKSEAKPRSGGARATTAKPKPATARRRAPARAKKEAEEPQATATSEAPESEAAEVETPVAEEKPAAKARPRRRAAAPKESPRPAPARPVVKAQAKYVRSSARKARLVLEHVRGKSIADARAVLRLSPRGVARDLERLLDSAVANAENNHDLVGDDLFVKEVYADEGPTLKRFRPRAQGRAYRVRKRTSHLTMTLTPKE